MQTKNKPTNSNKKALIILWSFFIIPIISLSLFFVLITYGVLGFMPTFEELENPQTNLATEIISSDGKILGTFFKENRIECQYNELSEYVIVALISTEDERFYKHSGIDFIGLSRVMFKTVLLGDKSAGGGSTISQQLAKMLFPREKFDNPVDIVTRKFREWVIAVKLEKSYTKEEIISMYLNKFDFLHNADGIKMASEVYFNKLPKNLKIEEAAMLVGMLKNPALFNPKRRPDTTFVRRNVVLYQMYKNDKINKQEFDSLKQLPLGLNFQNIDHNFGSAPYFREWLRMTITASKPNKNNYWSREIYKRDSAQWVDNPLYGWCNKNEKSPDTFYNIYKDGLKIYTTIDSRMQDHAEQAMIKHMKEIVQPAYDSENKKNPKSPYSSSISQEDFQNRIRAAIIQSERYKSIPNAKDKDWNSIMAIFKKRTKMTVFSWNGEIDTIMSPLDSIKYMKKFLQCGLLSMEAKTGHVKAFVGGINYKYFQYDHIMQQRRQVGSTFKPFLYTLAMQEGMSPCKEFANVPTSFYLADGTQWTPENSDDFRKGQMVSLAWALATSNNWISAKLMQLHKPEAVIALAREMGLYNHIDPVPSICLGVADLTLHEMVGAFATFPNKGVFTEPIFVTRIEDKFGKVISSFTPKQNEAISEETAYLMVNLLQNVVNMVDREAKAYGTAISLRSRYDIRTPLCGKTGTTNDHADGWFIGFSPELVTGVWVGGDERSIRFRSFRYGQGARMAMPMFAYYMKSLMSDSSNLGYHFTKDFEKPAHINYSKINCEKTGDPTQAPIKQSIDYDEFY